MADQDRLSGVLRKLWLGSFVVELVVVAAVGVVVVVPRLHVWLSSILLVGLTVIVVCRIIQWRVRRWYAQHGLLDSLIRNSFK